MHQNRYSQKKQSRKARSKWGTVIARYSKDGEIVAWQVRYPHPTESGKRVQRQFKPWQELEARKWLEEEKYLVDLQHKGILTWTHPTLRKREAMQEDDKTKRDKVQFCDYVNWWEKNYRLPNGEDVAGGTRRNLHVDIGHFMPFFVRTCFSLRLRQ